TDNSYPGTFTQFSGRFSAGGQTLTLTGLTPGQAYNLFFDLYVLDSWDGAGNPGPDRFEVSVDGQSLMNDTFSNYSVANLQTYNASAALPLQIVPTLTGVINGRPGNDSTFDLIGSGFMEGQSTITIGGIAVTDNYTNLPSYDVTSYYNGVHTDQNGQYVLPPPLDVEGPIRVTNAA